MKSRIIPMVEGARIANAVKVNILWKYIEDPGATKATVKVIGIDKNGEEVLLTMEIPYYNANHYCGSVFQCIDIKDKNSVYAIIDFKKQIMEIENISIHSFVTPLDNDSDAVSNL